MTTPFASKLAHAHQHHFERVVHPLSHSPHHFNHLRAVKLHRLNLPARAYCDRTANRAPDAKTHPLSLAQDAEGSFPQETSAVRACVGEKVSAIYFQLSARKAGNSIFCA